MRRTLFRRIQSLVFSGWGAYPVGLGEISGGSATQGGLLSGTYFKENSSDYLVSGIASAFSILSLLFRATPLEARARARRSVAEKRMLRMSLPISSKVFCVLSKLLLGCK